MTYCYNCGNELIQLKTESSWEKSELCSNAECKTYHHTLIGDAMGGGVDTLTKRRLTEEEYIIKLNEAKANSFLEALKVE